MPAPKPALCHPYTCCTKTGFVLMLNQPLQNRLCACSKTGFAPMLNLPHQNRLCAYAKPTAPKPALCCVRLQNLPWYKTCLVSRQVLHLLSKLQNWICSKTGQYKTCLVSNTKDWLCVYKYIHIYSWYMSFLYIYTFIYIYVYICKIYIYEIYIKKIYVKTGFVPAPKPALCRP